MGSPSAGKCDECISNPYNCRLGEHLSPTTVRFLRCDICKNERHSCTELWMTHRSRDTVKYYSVSAAGVTSGEGYVRELKRAIDEARRFVFVEKPALTPESSSSSDVADVVPGSSTPAPGTTIDVDGDDLPKTIVNAQEESKLPAYFRRVQDYVSKHAAAKDQSSATIKEDSNKQSEQSTSLTPDIHSDLPQSQPPPQEKKECCAAHADPEYSEDEECTFPSCNAVISSLAILLIGMICGASLDAIIHSGGGPFALDIAREMISNLSNEMLYCNITTAASQSSFTSPSVMSNFKTYPSLAEWVCASMIGVMVVVIIVAEFTSKRRTRLEEQLRAFERQSLSSLITFFKKKKYAKRIRGKAFLAWLRSLSQIELANMNGAIASCGAKLPDHLYDDFDSGSTRKCDMWKLWDDYSVEEYPGTVPLLQCALLQMAESGLVVAALPKAQKVDLESID